MHNLCRSKTSSHFQAYQNESDFGKQTWDKGKKIFKIMVNSNEYRVSLSTGTSI